ncbi:XRE family transcriptional regulator [Aestuariibacter sp. A3R04]|uniref:XRE family transcriptional regulator n=1 Tax=Aestuariibacter sp. A3R04 TaxID=2841571 RepID=UPI001C096415|nr:XRE family transcriptional regulator [Aestuariibacter sp. A3R04]MBU3022865.1 XRE family transcriptional regulator [Aestuariibacter sp. A3R04]
MNTTLDLIDTLKAAYNLPSDYAVAKKLGITRSAVSRYRSSGATLDDWLAIEVAELLERDPLQTLACVKYERAIKMNDKRLCNFWKQYAA